MYEWWKEFAPGFITERLEREAVCSFVPTFAAITGLDAGCGDGSYAIEAACRQRSR